MNIEEITCDRCGLTVSVYSDEARLFEIIGHCEAVCFNCLRPEELPW